MLSCQPDCCYCQVRSTAILASCKEIILISLSSMSINGEMLPRRASKAASSAAEPLLDCLDLSGEETPGEGCALLLPLGCSCCYHTVWIQMPIIILMDVMLA